MMKIRIVLALVALLAAVPLARAAGAFRFVAIGDMPYNVPGDYERFERLIARVNALHPVFTIHVGDTISGRMRCSDENILKVKPMFDSFDAPLVYTPGDNEWTDCHRLLGGGFDPVERQRFVRRHFFARPGMTLGRKPMKVEAQGLLMRDRFATYVENARFSRDGVIFATVHVVGSNNNLDRNRPATIDEFRARDAAAVAWIDDTFRKAQADRAKALVFAWQANVHRRLRGQPGFSEAFAGVINAVEKGAKAFGRPVLVVYGDDHFFMVAPFQGMSGAPAPHVTRLQVFGDLQVHGVVVSVDPDSAGVFGFTPLIVRENGLP